MPTYEAEKGWQAIGNQKNYWSVYTCSLEKISAYLASNPQVKHGVDCIVIGKSTHSLLGGHMMGSTARRVSRHSRVPVMLVPNK